VRILALSHYYPPEVNAPASRLSEHARIWREGETFLVEDLGSINGTVINDAIRLAPRQPRVIVMAWPSSRIPRAA